MFARRERTWAGFPWWALVFGFFLVPQVGHGAEIIPSIDVRVTIESDATIAVAERIVYDFGSVERHGIFRIIPYSYQAGSETYTAAVTDVTVTDENGEPIPFTESRARGELTLKIGNPERQVTGEQTYVISYRVDGPYLYFDDHDELIWNVSGSWPRPIGRVTVLVDLPPGAPVGATACYQGQIGSSANCTSEERLVGDTRAGYTATALDLAPRDGVTIAVAFPKGVIAARTQPWTDEPVTKIPPYWPLGLPLVVLVAMFLHWYARGRDPQGRGTVVTEFGPPDGLPPSVAGVVYDERVDDPELSAEIIRLAVEGYLRIHQFEEKVLWVFDVIEYVFEFVENPKGKPDRVQELILERLKKAEYQGSRLRDGVEVRGALLSKLKHTFASDRRDIAARVYEEVVAHRYFLARPDHVRAWYVGGGIAIMVAAVGVGVLLGTFFGVLLGFGIGLSGLIVAIGGVWMPVRTRAGVRAKEHLEGFRRYLAVAEKHRLIYQNSPERTPEHFDRLLPYAIAFGVERAWAGYFAELHHNPPSWYLGSGALTQSLTPQKLASDMSMFSLTWSRATAPGSSATSGGGSGAVGGGFGGGRGGSW